MMQFHKKGNATALVTCYTIREEDQQQNITSSRETHSRLIDSLNFGTSCNTELFTISM